MIFPVSASEPLCGHEEHIHSESCYATYSDDVLRCEIPSQVHQHSADCCDDQGQLVCQIADFVLHLHDEMCYDPDGVLVCPLPEYDTSIHEVGHEDGDGAECVYLPRFGHTHTDNCYTTSQMLICDISSDHTHGPECYESTLVCEADITTSVEVPVDDSETAAAGGQTDETESAASLDTSADSETTSAPEEHVHGEGCYESRLICEEHVHDDSCYETSKTLTCGQDDAVVANDNNVCHHWIYEEHIHDSSCYDESGHLVCGKWELRSHQHDETCFKKEILDYNSPVPTCGKEEYKHSFLCYFDLGQQEHDDIETFLKTYESFKSDGNTDSDTAASLLEQFETFPEDIKSTEYMMDIKTELEAFVVPNPDNLKPEDLSDIENRALAFLESADTLSDDEAKEQATNLLEGLYGIRDKRDVEYLIERLSQYVPVQPPQVFAEGTVEINGEILQTSDFYSMKDFLLSATFVSPSVGGKEFDLMDSETTPIVNVYQDFTVNLSFRFITDFGSNLNRLYAWQLPGAYLENPITGQLVNAGDEVFGDYYIDTNGMVYAVLNDLGMGQSIIDWHFSFEARWDETVTDDSEIDLGNGVSVKVEFDRSRGMLSKSGAAGDGKTVPVNKITFEVRLDAFDDIHISSVEDVFSLNVEQMNQTAYLELSNYLAEHGLNFGECVSIQSSGIELDDVPVATNLTTDISCVGMGSANIKFSGFDIDIPKGSSTVLTYILAFDPVMSEYIANHPSYTVHVDNSATVPLDGTNGEKLEASCSNVRLMSKNPLSKTGKFGPDYAEFTLHITTDRGYDETGGMILDTLVNPDVVFLTGSDGIWTLADETGSTTDLPVRIITSQGEFDGLTAGTAGGAVCVFGAQFKYFLPDVSNTAYVNLTYRTSYNSSMGTDVRSINRAYYTNGDTSYDTGGYIGNPTFKKTNNGIQYTDKGIPYVEWVLRADIPAGYRCNMFTLQDIFPYANAWLRDGLLATRTDDIPHGWTTCKGIQDLYNRFGITLELRDCDGADLSGQIKTIRVNFNENKQGTSPILSISCSDTTAITPSGYWGVFSAQKKDWYVQVTIPMYLAGDTESFKVHKNVGEFYKNSFADGAMQSTSTVELPDNGGITNQAGALTKMLSGREFDGTTLKNLSYKVSYDMSDVRYNPCKFFDDKISSSCVRYISGSLKVYLTEDITTSIEDMEPVGNDIVTVDSEADDGFRFHVDWSKVAYMENDEQHYPSMVVTYDVEPAGFESDGFANTEISNQFYASDHVGNILASVETSNQLYSDVLTKDLISTPSAENNYIGKYEILVDATDPSVRGLPTLDIIDEMCPEMMLLSDSIELYSGDSPDQLMLVSETDYKLLYNEKAHRLVCSIDHSNLKNYYKLAYNIYISGTSGTSITLSNRAFISGLNNKAVGTTDNFLIESSDSDVEAAKAVICVRKYNADNMTQYLSGAEFTLYTLGELSEQVLNDLNEIALTQKSRKAAIAYLETLNCWNKVVSDVTNDSGRILWVHDGKNLSLPLNTLFKLEETKAPAGYVAPNRPMYFYLSADSDVPAGKSIYLTLFEHRDFETTVYVPNQRGAFRILKVDEDTNEPLSGAVFELYDSAELDDASLVTTGIEQEVGTYYFGDLEFNHTYYLSETKPPEGYQQDATVYELHVDSNGITSISPGLGQSDGMFVLTNHVVWSSIVLPNTGGSSLFWGIQIFAFGVVVLAAGTIWNYMLSCGRYKPARLATRSSSRGHHGRYQPTRLATKHNPAHDTDSDN